MPEGPAAVRALRDRPLVPAVRSALDALLEGGVARGVEVLKPGHVHRVGPHVLKLYRRTRGRSLGLRGPRARRPVQAHFQLQPVVSPEPVAWFALAHASYESGLVYQHLEGETLRSVWTDGRHAPLESLPGMLSTLLSRSHLHADLHWDNLLWTGAEWAVLDLDAVRSRLHSLRRVRVVESTWGRLVVDFSASPEAERSFRAFVELERAAGRRPPDWRRVVASAEARARQRVREGLTPFPDPERELSALRS